MNEESVYSDFLIDKLVDEVTPLANAIDDDLKEGIAIHGAGFVGKWGAKHIKSIGGNIKFFIDIDKTKEGTQLLGIDIIHPSDKEIKSIRSIIIGARHAVRQVKQQYDKNFHTLSFDSYYVIKNYSKYKDVRDNYLEDEKSKYIYNALLYSMLTETTKSCLEVMEKDMYFAIPEFAGNFDEVFVDAGAFVGDSVERFMWENLGTFRHIYAFEPGEKQFAALVCRTERLLKEWAVDPDTITLVKAGLSEKNSEMSCAYLDDHPLRHALYEGASKNMIKTYSLDSFLKGKEVSFIKVDIEGMEMEFLHGAKNTIKKYKPKMALCAYHYPCDLFSLAQYVRELCPEYKFKIRHHAPLFGDFVLYCYCE